MAREPTPSAPRISLYDIRAEDYAWRVFASGFDNPVLLTHAGDGSGRLFGVEQTGMIWIVTPDGETLPEPFLDVSLMMTQDVMRGSYTERGLLGLAFHPNFARNRTFFIHQTDLNGDTQIVRYRTLASDPNRADPDSRTVILTIDQPWHDHNGGMIAFGRDGYLYVGMGDGGREDDPDGNGQNTTVLLGKILRIDVNAELYRVPPDNPFVGLEGHAPEIWVYGLRNPWRFSFDRATGDLYIGDVGQWSREEINYLPAGVGGVNLGWQTYEGTLLRADSAPDEVPTMPIAEYTHSEGCSVTGGVVYRGAALPDLDGTYLYGDYCNGRVWLLRRNAEGVWQNRLWMQTERQITAFGEDESGEIYLVDYKGDILRLERES
ncbi:MAG: glucose dehydrogenase [Phototrophicales bacterium]|nr:MAG: glucose dehydrogenase [Phototrophicales bacterium]